PGTGLTRAETRSAEQRVSLPGQRVSLPGQRVSQELTPLPSILPSTLSSSINGSLVNGSVEGTPAGAAEPSAIDVSTRAGTERRRMELADALTAGQREHEATS